MSSDVLTPIAEVYTEKRRPARFTMRWAAAAAAFVIAVGAGFGYGYYSVDSVIDFDVNPSIEIRINRAEKVLSATPLNAEAEDILDGMNLKNVKLDIAVNALIGSMLKNGYVSELKNSILISVENDDAQKSAELQQRLSSEVSSLLEAYTMGGAVISQTISEDERLRALADEHGVSMGKAALVDLLVSQDFRLQFADIAALPINDITLLISNKQAEVQGVSMSGQASSGAYIGEAKAKAIALEHAGLAESSATFIKARLDFDDGHMVYEVDLYTSEAEYEYEIDAVSGVILGYDRDMEKPSAPASTPSAAARGASPQDAADGGNIGEAQAISIALAHAGLKESDVSRLRAKLDRDDSRLVYEVEFRYGRIEYEYEIDAASGKILEWDGDFDD